MKSIITTAALLCAWLFPSLGQAATYSTKASEREVVAAVCVLEAGGDGARGIMAVMNVIENRSKARRISMRAVCLQKNQFSVLRRGVDAAIQKARTHGAWDLTLLTYDRFQAEKRLGRSAPDITGGAMYFESFRNHKPRFFRRLKPTVRIGGNQFYR